MMTRQERDKRQWESRGERGSRAAAEASLLAASQLQELKFAAAQMTGAARRAFEAEMRLKYCPGSARFAETLFGWSRNTVEGGLAEHRTGIACVGAPAAWSGRKRWEEKYPQAAVALREVAEAHAPQAPRFRTTVAYTRLTAKAAGEALRAQGISAAQRPSPSTLADGLTRMGYRLRQVVKAKPQKKMPQTDAICTNLKKSPGEPGPPWGQAGKHGR